MKRPPILSVIALLIVPAYALTQTRSNEPIPAMPKLLSLRQQADVRDGWIKKRFDTLLPAMMRRHGIDAWIVVNEEFHNDPVIEQIVSPIPTVRRCDYFVFFLSGDRVERFAIARYSEERIKNLFTLLSATGQERNIDVLK